MMNPTFSIIVPIYKVNQEYLRVCINSILKQTYEEFELILVDDGSPDDCGRICDVYAELDRRIKVIHQKNQGVSVARNSGIASARGEWILFVDADDWIEGDSLEILQTNVRNNLCDILIYRLVKDNTGRITELEYDLNTDYLYDTSRFEDKELFYRRVMNIPCVKRGTAVPIYYSVDKIFRRSFLIKNNLMYPIGLAKSEDKVFMAQCFEKAHYIYHINEQLYHYRMNDESICHRYSSDLDEQRKKMAVILQQIAKRMDIELGEISGDKSYKKITEGYIRFLFGIISDVLLLQYYHPDNPNKKNRRKEAIEFLESEPFKSAIALITYSSLSNEAKLKKFLLKHHFVSLFCFMKTSKFLKH